jgi:hypothetical protein
MAEFAIRDSEIVESFGTIGIQPSRFPVLLYGISESALRSQGNPGFMVFGGRAHWHGSFIHYGGDSIAFAPNGEQSFSLGNPESSATAFFRKQLIWQLPTMTNLNWF